MSTNTTSTSNGAGPGKPKTGAPESARAPAQGSQQLRYPFASFPMPDPATLEKLANEFFLALPRDLADGDQAEAWEAETEVESEEIPVTEFPPGPGTLPFQETVGVGPSPSVPVSSPSTAPGPLTETDLRAIAASLAGATALVPGTPGTAPQPPVAGSPPDFLASESAGKKILPIAAAPTLSPGNEMFSLPGIPGFPGAVAPTVPITGPPAGSNANPSSLTSAPALPGSTPYYLEGEKGASPAASPVLPPLSELFSFPRTPAMPNAPGSQTVPRVPAAPAAPSAQPANTTDMNGVSAPVRDSKTLAPEVPDIASADVATRGIANQEKLGIPGAEKSPVSSSVDSVTSVYPGQVSFPSVSEFFSFPGVPGVQSAPGIPAAPSPSVPTEKADLLRAVPQPTVPGSGNVAEAGEVPAQTTQGGIGTTSLVPGVGAFEFRTDLAPEQLGLAKRPLDARLIRRDFPILEERVHGRPLVWLDNAATTQKPNAVIDRLSHFYRHENSNIHRAAHELAARATDAYESAREKSRRFLNASSAREIIFVRGTTEGINLVAQSWGRRNVREGDEIVITWLEHHANIVPWQMLCAEKGAKLRVAPVNDRGEIILEEYERLLGPRTRIVSFSQVSNALGTVTPAREMIEIAQRYGARVLLDGAQAVSHMPVDVQTLGCDFYVFSGHKVFGPTGIGVVYGRQEVLDSTPPWQGGGNMIADVRFERTTYQVSPARFEAGTGNIADAVGLGAALDYVDQIGREAIAAYEHDLLNYGTEKLLTVPGLRLIGTAREKAGVMSFVLDDVRTEDVGAALNQEGIAVRAGHHCAQPILRRMGVESTVRPSLALYNTCEDIDALVAALLRFQAARGHRQLGNNA